MTSELSYREQLDSAIAKYKNDYLTPLGKYKSIEPMPAELIELLSYEKVINRKLSEVRSIKIPPLTFDAKRIIVEYYDALDNKNIQKENDIKKQAAIEKEDLLSKHDKDIQDTHNYNLALIKPMKAKHEELLSYKDDLSYVFEHYDITPLDVNISDNITMNEFGTLIDASIEACLKYKKKESNIFNRIIHPLENETNLMFTLSYVAIAILLIYFLLPALMLVLFPLMFMSIHNMYKDLEKLRVASSLMTQIDYNRFVPEEKFKQVEEVDTTCVDEKLEHELSQIKDHSVERASALKQLNEETASIAKECDDVRKYVASEYANVISKISDIVTTVHAKIYELMKDYKPFPNVQNASVVMSHNYTLGKFEDRLDVTAQVPMLNMVFNANDRQRALDTMKLYLANALLSVRVKQLTIEVYDPKNMCGDFTEFFTPDTKPYIKPNNMTLDNLLKTYREYSQQNVLTLDKKSIDDFNMNAEKHELVPKEYKLLLLISETNKLSEGENKSLFTEYFKFSAETGVMVWMLDTKQWPNSIWVDGSYNTQGSRIDYTPELGKKAVDTYSKALQNYKDTGIDYATKFGDVFIPRDKWWTFDTIEGIKMPFGLENGDPTRGLNVAPVMGDANVHALLGGATGAGKSAAINQLLMSLITMYPPSELQIVYVDFKNVEAAKFTAGFDRLLNEWLNSDVEKEMRETATYYTRLSRIPHLRIISGTTDGEYALSVFEFLMAEMANRQKLINMYGVTKVEEMRKQILASYNSEHNGDKKKGTWAEMRKNWEWYKPNVYDKYGDLPRLLIIFDEYQVMYNREFVEDKIIDKINGKLTAFTKLARAMSSHFWFTSQSMKGTMSKDTMGNFSLRGALRCDADVSDELLGNRAASTIKAKFGFMYTNDSAGQNKDANKFWRVPFLDEKNMPAYIDELNEMLVPFNETHDMAEFYDEKILVPASVIDDWYNSYPDTFKDNKTLILGERASFSTNKAPVSIALQEDTGENMLVTAFDRNDMLNLTTTLLDNIRKKEDCTIIMNVQDIETHTMLDVNSIVSKAFLELSYPKQDIPEFITALNTMVDHRIEIGGPYKPVFVFCVQWERAAGISVDINYKQQDVLKDVLRKGPTVGVHFIFCSKEKMDMPRLIPAACNHRIAGMIPKDANFFIETSKVEKLPDATKDAGLFAFYEFGTTLTKLRIYQHVFTKTVKSREIIL